MLRAGDGTEGTRLVPGSYTGFIGGAVVVDAAGSWRTLRSHRWGRSCTRVIEVVNLFFQQNLLFLQHRPRSVGHSLLVVLSDVVLDVQLLREAWKDVQFGVHLQPRNVRLGFVDSSFLARGSFGSEAPASYCSSWLESRIDEDSRLPIPRQD